MAKNERRPRRYIQEPPRSVHHPIVSMVKGAGLSILVSLFFSLFLAVISMVTDLSNVDRYMPYIFAGAAMCSVFIGSAYVTQQAKSRGLLIGAGVGALYVLVAMAVDLHLAGEAISTMDIGQKAFSSVFVGAIGGIVGANL
jgi:putative membrane protein (TIGR04086 family)